MLSRRYHTRIPASVALLCTNFPTGKPCFVLLLVRYTLGLHLKRPLLGRSHQALKRMTSMALEWAGRFVPLPFMLPFNLPFKLPVTSTSCPAGLPFKLPVDCIARQLQPSSQPGLFRHLKKQPWRNFACCPAFASHGPHFEGLCAALIMPVAAAPHPGGK